ncbi:MAG: hypothetical protein E6R07_12845 [Nevskiaceae bacterium]|nr:MAG: hypothetical protein E6R07_12845 [Nevskiaceae bacterium]
MSAYRRILVVLDHDANETPALHRAVALARASGAELRIRLYARNRTADALDHMNHRLAGIAQESALSRCRDWLEDLRFELQESGLRVQTEVQWQTADAINILNHALDDAPDLLVKDAGRASRLRTLVPISVDHELLRLCPFPLYLVHREGHRLPEKVAAAVDPQHPWHRDRALNERVLRAARDCASQSSASLELFSVFTPAPPHAASDAATAVPARAAYQAELERLAARYGAASARTHTLDGEPVQALTAAVHTHDVDLLVIGSLCRRNLTVVVAGSVAARLIDTVDCDVLAIKPAGFEQDFVQAFGVPLNTTVR